MAAHCASIISALPIIKDIYKEQGVDIIDIIPFMLDELDLLWTNLRILAEIHEILLKMQTDECDYVISQFQLLIL